MMCVYLFILLNVVFVVIELNIAAGVGIMICLGLMFTFWCFGSVVNSYLSHGSF